MVNSITSKPFNPNRDAFLVFLLVGYSIAFFLYYIDEGNYHFEGLRNPAEWIFVTMYALVFAGIFSFFYAFLKKLNLSSFGKILVSVIMGIGGMISILYFLF